MEGGRQRLSECNWQCNRLSLHIPGEFGDLTHKVEVGCLLLGRGINVDQADVVPQRNFLVFRRADSVEAVVHSVLHSFLRKININAGSTRRGSLHFSYIVEGNKLLCCHRGCVVAFRLLGGSLPAASNAFCEKTVGFGPEKGRR